MFFQYFSVVFETDSAHANVGVSLLGEHTHMLQALLSEADFLVGRLCNYGHISSN